MGLILRYLDNSELENKERAQLREIMCYKLDGKSSQRITTALLEQLSWWKLFTMQTIIQEELGLCYLEHLQNLETLF